MGAEYRAHSSEQPPWIIDATARGFIGDDDVFASV